VNGVIEEIRKVTGKNIKVIYSEKRTFDVKDNVLSNVLAQKELGWGPTVGLHEGMTQVYNWLKMQ